MRSLLLYFKTYSKTAWLYTLILFIPILRKTVFNRQREMSDFATVDSNNIISIIVTLVMIIILFFYIDELRKKINTSVRSFTFYYILAFFSFLWAGMNKLPFITYKAVEVIATFYFVGNILIQIDNRKKILRYIILLTTLITSVDMINSNFAHTNAYSFTGMIGVLLCLGSIKYNILKWNEVWIMLLLCTLGVIFGTSSASNVAIIVGLLFLFGSGKRGVNILTITIFILLCYFIYTFFEKQIYNIIFAGKNYDEVQSMTGRRAMWELFWKGWLKRPFLGYGFSFGEKNSTIFGWNTDLGGVGSAHNMFISVLINTGLIGMILWLRFLFILFTKTYKRATIGNKYASLLLPVFIGIVANSNSFPAIGSEWSFIGTICYALIIFALCFIYPSASGVQRKRERLYKELQQKKQLFNPQIKRITVL